MCLILVAWRTHADYPLVAAANRDEFHGRPAAAAGFWSDSPSILAGRDLEAGGSWMGVARGGNFAAVTNYRGAHEPRAAESRGALVAGFLEQPQPAAGYVESVRKKRDSYSGFNLLVADADELWWLSNRDGQPRRLEPGIYGLGNALLDAPELEEAKARFAAALRAAPAVDSLFEVLAPNRIVDPRYGTRCSTVLRAGKAEIRYAERSFHADGAEAQTLQFELDLPPRA